MPRQPGQKTTELSYTLREVEYFLSLEGRRAGVGLVRITSAGSSGNTELRRSGWLGSCSTLSWMEIGKSLLPTEKEIIAARQHGIAELNDFLSLSLARQMVVLWTGCGH